MAENIVPAEHIWHISHQFPTKNNQHKASDFTNTQSDIKRKTKQKPPKNNETSCITSFLCLYTQTKVLALLITQKNYNNVNMNSNPRFNSSETDTKFVL